MTFASLGLSEPILAGIRRAGYETPTEIQARAIPTILAGKDLIALGETGSGKTAAFGLPILERLVGGPRGLRALILVPTRELCVQVAESLRTYASATELAICTAFGGIDLSIQRAAFKRGLDVLVACPGRLLDHLQQGSITLAEVGTVVLDEADRMLDMGFLPQIRSIFVRCPQQRQNLLFSATMPKDIEDLCADFLPGAERVQIGRRSQAARTISHSFAQVAGDEKVRHLRAVLERERGRVLIFVRTKTRAEQLGNALKRSGLPADSIHGDKGAEERYIALKAFERGKVRFLVATDVAARGIDVSDIGLVINFDMPRALEDYVHRVGRTGRAGNVGRALSLVAPAERSILESVRRHLGTVASGTGSGQIPARDDARAADGDAPRAHARSRRRRRRGPAAASRR
ncbi:MAG TPA: DEAD/DEAH box helicase [Planctomycetota bacterium]|nr:DEAD/DEAH box helicase [Planctomycetota bacterium]